MVYAEAADATYTIGPVVFWAFAEMTCGFVVSCMPSAPRLLKETRVLHRIKARLGMRLTTVKNSHATGGSSALNNVSKPSTLNTGGVDRYRKIDDDGVRLENLGPNHSSESTETLHKETAEVRGGKMDGAQSVLRTTQVTIKSEYQTDSDDNDGFGSQTAAWKAGARGTPMGHYGGRR